MLILLIRIPVHPMLVPFPIAFNLLTWSLDFLSFLSTTTYIKLSFFSTDTLIDISRLADLSSCIGLITSVPALATGNLEFYRLLKKEQVTLFGKEKKPVNIQVALIHGAVNNVVFIASLGSWIMRRTVGTGSSIQPPTASSLISLICVPFFLGAARLGWSLVHNLGVGLKFVRKAIDEVKRAESRSSLAKVE